MSPRLRRVELDGVGWEYAERGRGPLLVLLHGALSGKEIFAHQVAELSVRYRCVAVDWPGHGGSGYDPAGWTIDDLVAALPRFIDAVGGPAAVLAGVSQGGGVALRVALEHPRRVRGLVLMSAGPDGPRREVADAVARLGETLRDGDEATRSAAVDGLQRTVLHAPGWVDEHPEAAAREARLILGHDREAMPLVTRVPGTYTSVESRLGEVGCPTLVIWGADDPRASWGPRMVELLPDAHLQTFPDCGHHVPLDQPEATTDALRRFLDRLPPR